jgi:phosphatidylglycerol---prolipoprotein diacylglyceryl transferase
MRQTLFYLPHQLGPLPLFGWLSWSMIALIVYVLLLISVTRNRIPWQVSVKEGVFNWGIGAFILGFLLPMIETRIGQGTSDEMIVGLPVRGYGVLMMLGVASAIWIANRRIESQGISREAFFSLALWSVLGGLIGARLFYVLQKWEELPGDTLSAKLWVAAQFTEGGLVVYGGAMGGLLGILLWTWKNKTRPMPLLDAIAPAFFIGLAFGRIGCLLNGCCYGGVCEGELPAITFPRGSPAYVDQLQSGRLLGIRTDEEPGDAPTIREVAPGSWAADHGIHSGQALTGIEVFSSEAPSPTALLAPPKIEGTMQVDRRSVAIPASDLPDRSLPVHPSQIYASISGFLLFLWTLSIPNWLSRPGVVLGSALIAYGIFRILEEFIRVDEAGQFGTDFSISQWISFVGIALGIVLLIASRRHAFAPQTS